MPNMRVAMLLRLEGNAITNIARLELTGGGLLRILIRGSSQVISGQTIADRNWAKIETTKLLIESFKKLPSNK